MIPDSFGGFYFTGTFHTAAGDRRIGTWRSSTLLNGGGWRSFWSVAASENNYPTAIAVRGTTVCVAGKYDAGGASGIDQLLLTYNY